MMQLPMNEERGERTEFLILAPLVTVGNDASHKKGAGAREREGGGVQTHRDGPGRTLSPQKAAEWGWVSPSRSFPSLVGGGKLV